MRRTQKIVIIFFAMAMVAYVGVRIVNMLKWARGKAHDSKIGADAGIKPENLRLLTYAVQDGDTLDKIFSDVAISPADGESLRESLNGRVDLRRMQIGDELDFLFERGGLLRRFRYRSSIAEIYEAERIEGGYAVSRLDIPVDAESSYMQVVLEDSLYQAFTDAGEGPELIEKLVDIFAWDIDFFADPREGDVITLVVEKKSVGGEFYKYGKVVAAYYNGKVVRQQAHYFETGDGKGAYYDKEGRPLAKNFLKTPVKFTRISSHFGMRTHPITHRLQKHLGADYVAPTGTPVWAMADGVVVKKGYKGYNGNYIEIRHANGYSTQYLHLSRFSTRVKAGGRVSQKEVIGYVGTTGRSTGPHLHLGMIRNGEHVNPLKLKQVKSESLAGEELASFKLAAAPMAAFFSEGSTGAVQEDLTSSADAPFDSLIELNIFPMPEDDVPDAAARRHESFQH